MKRSSPDTQRPNPTPPGDWGAVFRREGDFWTVAYDGVTLRLRHGKGVQYVAQLLAQPGERVSVVALGGGTIVAGDTPAAERSRVAVTKRIKQTIRGIAAQHPALGYHLTTTIKTGRRCVYLPDPRRPVAWSM